MSESAAKISNPELRELVKTVGDRYRDQLKAIVRVNDRIADGSSPKQIGRALADVRRAANRKTDAALALVDAVPGLAEEIR